ncbi:MAG: hypothetical protein ACTSRP_20460 [Candidatus Helarchaeota archaeon]
MYVVAVFMIVLGYMIFLDNLSLIFYNNLIVKILEPSFGSTFSNQMYRAA